MAYCQKKFMVSLFRKKNLNYFLILLGYLRIYLKLLVLTFLVKFTNTLLGNFALAEDKDGGTFYTPASVVQYMVEVIKPEAGSEKKFLEIATTRLIPIQNMHTTKKCLM